MGYTPVFSDIYMGTLYGRWPAAAVWASLLPLFDRNGLLDMSVQAIAGMTGWPLALLEEGIKQLSEPDGNSRSNDSDGCRLVALDSTRPWGWRAVNHGKYREKARLMAKSQNEVESGKNKGRMVDRRPPPETAADPLSDLDKDIDKKEKKETESPRASARTLAGYLPDDFSLTPERRAVAAAERVDADRTFQTFVDYWRGASGAKARKRDWDATWRNWCKKAADYAADRNGNSKGLSAVERVQRATGVRL